MAEKRDDSLCEDEDILNSQFSSQDNFLESSQDQDDSLCEVKWDYSSPETMKQLKKMRGKYSAQDVKRIIAKFPDMPIKPVQSTFPCIKFSLPPPNPVDVTEKSRLLRVKQRAAKRWQQRERCRGAVEDMIAFLQQRQKKENAASTDGPVEVSTEKSSPKEEKLNGNVNEGNEYGWSDDDMFRDNSFLIEATQNLEKMLPLLDKAPDTKLCNSTSASSSISNSCDLFSSTSPHNSVVNSTSVIPSSYVGQFGKDKSAPTTKTRFDKNYNIQTHVSRPVTRVTSTHTMTKPSCSKASYTSNSSHMNKPVTRASSSNVSSFYGNKPTNGMSSRGIGSAQNKLSAGANVSKQNAVIQQNNASANTNASQRPFRKHHTFQGNKARNQQTKNQSPSIASPFRRCLSFDDTNSSKSKSSASVSNTDSSFDSSLSDELLLQATEDVDSLVNQKTIVTNCNPKSSHHCDPQSSSMTKPQYYNNLCSSKDSYKTTKDINIANTLLSPVRPLKQEASIKKLQVNPLNSPVQSFFKKSFAVDVPQTLKHKSALGPHSSTPIKMAKTSHAVDNVPNKTISNKASDSFMDDDSFMNDEAMFESQILPILQLAETQVTTGKSNVSTSPAKYSPDEIEKKRQAAMQKLQKNNHVQEVKNKSPDAGGGTFQPNQTTCSPRKCSQDEIDRKKQAAQRKLLAKTNSTGSLNFSQQVPMKGPSDKSPNKCSQDEIKMKKEEALKKRKLKLQQTSGRKS